MRLPRRALSGGEIDPDLRYASDLAPVRVGASRIRNMIVRQRGGVERLPGTEHIDIAKTTGKVVLRPFRRDQLTNYVCEWGDSYLRIRDANLTPGGAYIELATPYLAGDLPKLNFTGSNDIQWVFSGKKVKELQRQAAGWALVDAKINNGPFLDLDPLETRSITASALTGAITLTASAATFNALHVGAYFRLEEQDYSATPKWQISQAVTIGLRVRYNGNTYRCTVAGTTSNNPPTHLEGAEKDGTTGTAVEWTYEHSGYGIVKISGFTSTTVVSATVIKRLPHQANTTGTKRWQEGAWSDFRGWPTCGTLYKNALWAASTLWQPSHLWKSWIDGFDNWEPTTADDGAITRPLYSEQTQAITWLANTASYLAVGAGGAEWVARPDRQGDTVRVNNLITDVATTEGTVGNLVVSIGKATIFPDASRTRLIEMTYDYQSDAWDPDELSLLAAHLLGARIVEMAWQRSPWPVIWLLLGDGKVAGITYHPKQQVRAWHLHDFGDPVETICVLPVEGAAREALFLGVRRSASIHIERMADRLRPETGQDISDAWYLMAAKRYAFAAPQTLCTGLAHLEGRQVVALVDGFKHPPLTVTGGQVTLNFPGEKVLVGLSYLSEWRDLPPDFGQPDDDQASRRKKVTDVGLALRDTLGGDIVVNGVTEPAFRLGSAPLDTMPSLFTGIKNVAPPSADDDDAIIGYQNDTPWPATLTGLFPEYEV